MKIVSKTSIKISLIENNKCQKYITVPFINTKTATFIKTSSINTKHRISTIFHFTIILLTPVD